MALGELLIEETGTITNIRVLPATAEVQTTKFASLLLESCEDQSTQQIGPIPRQ